MYSHYYRDSVKARLTRQSQLAHALVVIGSPAIFAVVMLVSVLLPQHSYAASYTWDGGGATNNWSDCANWSSDICPVAADSVTFNATSVKDSVIDGAWGGSIAGVTVGSAYTGTVTMARSLTLSGVFNQTGGTFDATNQTLDLNSTLVFTGGTFTAPSTAMTVASSFTISGGTFNANGGVLMFDTSTTATVSCNNSTFNLVTFAHPSGTKTVSSNCNLPLGSSPAITGPITLNGTLTGTGTLTTGGITILNSGSALSGFTGYISNAAFSSATTTDFSSYGVLDFNNTMNLSAGANFTAPSGTMSVYSHLGINAAATFNANGGTLDLDGTGNVTCGGATFNLVLFTIASTSTKTIAADCNLPLGNDPSIPIRIVLNGAFSGSGSLSMAGGTAITFNATAAINGFTSLSTSTTVISGATLDFSSYTSVTVSTFTFSSGTVIAPSAEMNFLSGFTIASGANFDANGGTMVLKGNGTYVCNGADFNLLRLEGAGTGANTIDSTCTFPLGHDPTIPSRLTNMNGILEGTGTLTVTQTVFTLNGGIQGFTDMAVALLVINTNATLGSLEEIRTTISTMTINSPNTDFSNLSVMHVGSSMSIGTNAMVDLGALTSLYVGGTTTVGTGATLISPTTADFNNSFVANAGSTFTSASGTASFAGAMTLNATSTFNANGGTVVFDGAISGAIVCSGAVFNYVRFEATNGTKTVSSDCSLPLGHDPVLSDTFTLVLNGTVTGSGKIYKGGGGGVTLNTPDAFNMFGEFDLAGVNIGADQNWSYLPSLGLRGTLTLTGGTIVAPSSMAMAGFVMSGGQFEAPTSMSVRTAFTYTGGTFNHNNGTVSFDNPGNGDKYTINCNGAVFNRVVLNYGKHIAASCTLPLGDNPVMGAGRDYSVNGTLAGTGALTAMTSVWLTSTYQLSGFTDLNFGLNLRLINANIDLSNYQSTTIGRDLLIEGTSVLTAPEGELPIARSISLASTATFDPNGGTVVLTGTDQTLTGDIEFHNLTKTTAGILTVGAGNTITTTGLFKLSGPSLVSSAPGSTWNINMQGTTNICYVSVTDSNSIGNAVVAYQSTSNSANPGWVFLNAACPGSGGGGGGSGGGGEPVSTVTNYTNAQAAATAAVVTSTTPNTTLPPYYGLPSTLAKTVDTIPGSRDALRAFLRFVGVTGLVMVFAGGIIWLVIAKRRHQDDEYDAVHMSAH